MPNESARDSLTEWFHQLASLEHSELVQKASIDNQEKLRLHIERSVLECEIPTGLTEQQFANTVLDFRKNESAWNHAVMASLIKADELFKEGLAGEAVSELHRFASSCPWALFREVALNQATHYIP
jgi:hypothetical protein